jgi:hypothetical protein
VGQEDRVLSPAGVDHLPEEGMLREEVVREIVARLERGEGVKAIARTLEVDRKTVKRWRRLGGLAPADAPPPRQLDPGRYRTRRKTRSQHDGGSPPCRWDFLRHKGGWSSTRKRRPGPAHTTSPSTDATGRVCLRQEESHEKQWRPIRAAIGKGSCSRCPGALPAITPPLNDHQLHASPEAQGRTSYVIFGAPRALRGSMPPR